MSEPLRVSGLRHQAATAISVEVGSNFGPGAAALYCALVIAVPARPNMERSSMRPSVSAIELLPSISCTQPRVTPIAACRKSGLTTKPVLVPRSVSTASPSDEDRLKFAEGILATPEFPALAGNGERTAD